ncbi:MAG TPA: Crp/Fnr family transcriptional regulator [Thermodesulfobacteriaceae bacterium]|nr:Crp/Fnr family transcriptional regulator [Thermodesulfobacteriaceae bacterium]
MKDKLTVIKKTPLFKELSPQFIDEIARITLWEEYDRGEMIFSEGQPGKGFYVIESGKIKVFKLSVDGKEQILHILGPGEPFAEVAVFAGGRFPANAQAIETARVLFFPRKAFVELISREPMLAMNMLALLAMRLRKFTKLIENLSLREVPARLAAFLVVLSSKHEGADRLKLDLSKSQLASLLGTIPETLSRIFFRMSREGVIVINGSEILITDRERLEELAAGLRRLS